MITLTKIKLAGGDETPRFEATVCWNGKPVGIATNGGTGGASRVWWAVTRTVRPPRRGVLVLDDGVTCTDKATVEAVMREAARVAKKLEPDLFAKLDPEQAGPLHYVGLWEDALDVVLMSHL